MEQNVLIAPVNLVFQHERCMVWERKQEIGDFREINAPGFHVFPTSVLIWMALRSFSHISLICLVLVWITSILLWPSLSSLDANSFKETTLECPRGLISLTKSLNFFSSTCRINGDTDLDVRISAYLYERNTEKESLFLLCITQMLCTAICKCKSLDKPKWSGVRRRHLLSWSSNTLCHREKLTTSWQAEVAQIKS